MLSRISIVICVLTLGGCGVIDFLRPGGGSNKEEQDISCPAGSHDQLITAEHTSSATSGLKKWDTELVELHFTSEQQTEVIDKPHPEPDKTREYFSGHACTRRVKSGTEVCEIYTLSMQRSSTNGGSTWSGWGPAIQTPASKRIRCANLDAK